ncbi:MAG: VCBS repeat-containing protein [Proteobacteria bacterium]|nr:VCBS repeat-containing protein [Pseudomonadota bacterium]
MSKVPTLIVISLALLGCRPEEEPEPEPVSTVLEMSEVVGLEVAAHSGGVPLTTIARATNAMGASVLSAPDEVVVGGTTVAVNFDGLGYGEVTVDTAGSQEVLGGDEAVMLHGFDSDWPGFGMQGGEVPLGEAIFAEPLTNGIAVASSTEVWWVGTDLPPHRVLAFDSTQLITGIRAGHADADGRGDLLVWGGDTVVLLRGRPGGGLAWSTGFQAEGMAAVGAALGDPNADGAPDVAIAWAGAEGTSVIEMLEGDGLGSYHSQTIDLADVPQDVALGDGDGDGADEVTALVGAGWARFTYSELNEDYETTGPNLNGLNFVAGTRITSGRDFKGDGADELVFVGPLQAGQDREILLYDLVGQANVQFLRLTPNAAQVAIGDGNLDGLSDLFMLHDDEALFTMMYDGPDSKQRDAAQIDDYGPIAVSEVAAEDLPEVLVAGDTWTWWQGTTFVGESEEQWWAEGEPQVGNWSVDFDSYAQVEADGNASTIEIAGLGRSGGATVLEVFQLQSGTSPSLTPFGPAVTLANPARNVEDVAICGADVYALLDGELHKATIGGSTTSVATTGTAVACGVGPSGTSAATLAGDTITLWTSALASAGTQVEAGAEDLALGVSGPDLAVCTAPGCGVVYWPWGSTGDWAIATGDGIEVGESMLHGGGQLSVADVDADGNPDLVARWGGGMIGVYRSTGDGFGPGEIFHMSRALVGAPIVVDASGEGDADLLVLDDAGSLYITPTPGTAPSVNGSGR